MPIKLTESEYSLFKPDRWLQSYFTEFNKKYFSGRLGHTQLGWNEALSKTRAIGITVTTVDDTANSITHTIQIDPKIKEFGDVVKLTVLHEMAHIKLFPYINHGKRFDEEMLILATKGAFNAIW